MLQDDELWNLVMGDAAHQQLSMQMRELFVMLLEFCDVNEPSSLFGAFWEKISEDYEHQLTTIANENLELQKWMILIDIKERLESTGNGQLFQRKGTVTAEMELAVSNARRQYNLYGVMESAEKCVKSLLMTEKKCSIPSMLH